VTHFGVATTAHDLRSVRDPNHGLSDNLPVTSTAVAQRSYVDAQPLGDPDAAGVVQSTSMIYDSFLIFQRLLPTSR